VAEKPEEYEVTVLSRETITTFPKIDTPVETVLVTYVAAGLPPHTLYIPKKEWTLEKEKELIKKDIQERLKRKPEVYKV